MLHSILQLTTKTNDIKDTRQEKPNLYIAVQAGGTISTAAQPAVCDLKCQTMACFSETS